MVRSRFPFARAFACFLVALPCAACGSTATDAPVLGESTQCPSHFATSVESFSPGPGPDFGQADLPDIVLGAPKGLGDEQGSLDVVTLGNGGSITLGFAPSAIVDGPGPDFIVFENPFYVAGSDPPQPFAELGTVEVSDDGHSFVGFPCTASAPPFGSCAGWHPVYANPDKNSIDPTDPAVAGGDAFDLADLGVSHARYVRITDRVDITGLNGSFDLDAVSIVHAGCP
ncbi:MAG: cell surface protein [Myxococcales bacterium]